MTIERERVNPSDRVDLKINGKPPSMNERSHAASKFPDLYEALNRLLLAQAESGKFFGWSDDKNTLDYAVKLPGDSDLHLEKGQLDLDKFPNKPEFIFIQNVRRAGRPAVAGGVLTKADLRKKMPDMLHNAPLSVLIKYPYEHWLEWVGPSENPWWVIFSPYPIWPPKNGQPLSQQPFHALLVRADESLRAGAEDKKEAQVEDLSTYINQFEMRNEPNLRDTLAFFVELNSSRSRRGDEPIRLFINGWDYATGEVTLKGGASQLHIHAQLVRFDFPIEMALTKSIGETGPVSVSVLAKSEPGTALVLEAPIESVTKLSQLLAQALQLITDKGHSFNVLATMTSDKKVRLYIADRTQETPTPYFTNMWGFSEFGRAIVIDAPETFYNMNQAQKSALNEALNAAKGDTAQAKKNMIKWTLDNRRDLTQVNPALAEYAKQSLAAITVRYVEIWNLAEKLIQWNVGSQTSETDARLEEIC